MHHTMSRLTRRSLLHGSLLLSLAAVSPLRTLLVQDVAAEKNTGKKITSIAKRVTNQQQLCEVFGGTLAVSNGPRVTTTTCNGGKNDGYTCINSAKQTACVQTLTNPDLPDQPLQPDSPFAQAGDVQEVPLESDGGGVVITSYAGGTHERARRRAKRHQPGRGRGRTG